MHNLTVEQKEYAAKVLNETDENRESAIAEIKRWHQESDLNARTGKNDSISKGAGALKKFLNVICSWLDSLRRKKKKWQLIEIGF